MARRSHKYSAQTLAYNELLEESRRDWSLRIKRGAFILLAAAICLVIVATNAPQIRELQKLESELDDTLALEAETLERKQQVQMERHALQTDEEYLQLIARDHLDRAMPGERIIRIQRSE